jgi:hypothetical protein
MENIIRSFAERYHSDLQKYDKTDEEQRSYRVSDLLENEAFSLLQMKRVNLYLVGMPLELIPELLELVHQYPSTDCWFAINKLYALRSELLGGEQGSLPKDSFL